MIKKIAFFISTLSDMTNRFITFFVISLLFLLSLLLGVAVFYRYILNDSIYWSNEVARYLLAYIVFLGSTIAHKNGVHIRVDTIFSYISQKKRWMIELFITLSFIFFWTVVLFGSIKLMPLFLMQTTATLQMPFAYVFVVVPLASIIWIVYLVDDLLKEVIK
jgi:TRAP-type C4-dicarboxylate transport system permease small subunit